MGRRNVRTVSDLDGFAGEGEFDPAILDTTAPAPSGIPALADRRPALVVRPTGPPT